MSTYKLEIKKKAKQFIKKQPPKQQRKIYEGICKLPFHGDIANFKGKKGYFRLRVGDYRIIYSVDHGIATIIVVDADNRGQIYK